MGEREARKETQVAAEQARQGDSYVWGSVDTGTGGLVVVTVDREE